jgi:hypothetical protein
MVLSVGQVQAELIHVGTLVGGFNENNVFELLGEEYGIDDFEPGLGVKLEFENGVVDNIEGGLEDYFDVDLNTGTISWDVTDLACNVLGVVVKYGEFTLVYAVRDDQQIVGIDDIPTEYNGHEISNIAFYVPDGSVMLLLGSSLIILALLGRRKNKRI